ncbi:MAG: TolC family protein [Elusimicrobia bacterium]|nr:TolC family protein [Elusimicrobiota bacterium]
MSILLAVFLATGARAQPPTFSLTLEQAEIAARAHSQELKAAAEQSAAAKDAAGAQFASLFPRLSLDGFYQYQAVLPQLALFPNQTPLAFGAQHERSIGPSLSWTLWDEGALYKSWKSQQAAATSQDDRTRLTELQTVLSARLAYAQAQLAREQVRLLGDSVALADAQYADVARRRGAGAASRIDELSSHQEDLQRRADFFEAQAGLASALRSLFQIVGMGDGLDLMRPVDARSGSLPAGLPVPTLRVALDALARMPPSLAAVEAAAPSAQHPGVLIYQRQAESARLAAQGTSAADWPLIQLNGAIDYEYPNGPQLVYVTQKTIGLTASVPLFEMRQTARLSSRQQHLATAAERERDLAAEELARDWDKARAALASLRDEQVVDDRAAAEAAELAHLVYLSYKAGRSTYLDVQTYDLAALTTKVSAAKTRAQTLIQLATLAELGAKE